MNAGFLKRAVSYMIDVLIITIISTIVSLGIKTNTEEYEEELSGLMETYMQGDLTTNEYLEKTENLTYNIEKESVIPNTINIVITIGYLIVFSYLNKGQTLGKKLLKIKIVEHDTKKDPTLKSIIIRSILVYTIVSSLYNVIAINFLNERNYFTGNTALTFIEGIIIIASAIMILYRNDKRGLHDLIAATEVIEVKGE